LFYVSHSSLIKKKKQQNNKTKQKQKKRVKKKEKVKGKERGNVRSDPCMLCYHGFVLGRACNMFMMAEGAGSNICSQSYPKFRDWEV